MVEATARGEGQREDPGDRRIEVEVEHLHGTIANATVRSDVYVEYLQLVHTRHGWKIVNACGPTRRPARTNSQLDQRYDGAGRG
jgi:hypothetical protein